jgi:hypothetical protein
MQAVALSCIKVTVFSSEQPISPSSRVKRILEEQRPLLWKTFKDSFAWVKEFHSNNFGDIHFPVQLQPT